jgi:hypothetical protein
MLKAISTFGVAIKDAGIGLARRKRAKKKKSRPDYEGSAAGYFDAMLMPDGIPTLKIKRRRLN